jgi:hypothetical protein
MMDAQSKAKWVEALRSGKYDQCRTQLRDGIGFCCIGVGYQVLVGSCDEIEVESDETDFASDAIGLRGKEQKRLIVMNDDEEKSFEEIADYIEKNL